MKRLKLENGGITLEFLIVLPIIIFLIMISLNSIQYNTTASIIIRDAYQAARFSTVQESCLLSVENLEDQFPQYTIYYKYTNFNIEEDTWAREHNEEVSEKTKRALKSGEQYMILECDVIWDRGLGRQITLTAVKRNFSIGLDLIIPKYSVETISLYIEHEHEIHNECAKYNVKAKTVEDMEHPTNPELEYHDFLKSASEDILEDKFSPVKYCRVG